MKPYKLLGLRVRTTKTEYSNDSEWTSEGLVRRSFPVDGVVVGHHDSHSLCFDVLHDKTGVVGCYDPWELMVLEIDDHCGCQLEPAYLCPKCATRVGAWRQDWKDVGGRVRIAGFWVRGFVYNGWSCTKCGCKVHSPARENDIPQ